MTARIFEPKVFILDKLFSNFEPNRSEFEPKMEHLWQMALSYNLYMRIFMRITVY